jgi:positive regulator of sigma E activity
MRENGKVVSTRNGRAEVEVAAKGECEHCSARGVCNWTGTSVRKVLAANEVGAVAGDTVEVETGTGTGARANLLVFGIPVVLMLAGVLVGGLILRRDVWSAVLAGAGLVLGFGIVKAIDTTVNRSGRSLPVIVGLAEKSEACPARSDGGEATRAAP